MSGPVPDPVLAAELCRRAREDERLNAAVLTALGDAGPDQRAPDGASNGPPNAAVEAAARCRANDRDSRRWLAAVVAERGWPGISEVGRDASRGAWLIAQHAQEEPDVQQRLLDALARAVADGDAQPWQLAYLTDRVLTLRGLPQRYGTQYRPDGRGGVEPFPVEEPDRVDALRDAIGLPSMEAFAGQWKDRVGEMVALAEFWKTVRAMDTSPTG